MLTLKEKISKLKLQYSESRDQSRSKSKSGLTCKKNKQRESGSLEGRDRNETLPRNPLRNLPDTLERPVTSMHQQSTREKMSLLNFLNGGSQVKLQGPKSTKSPTFIKLLPKDGQFEAASERKEMEGPKELRTEVRRKYLEKFKLLNFEYSVNTQKKSSVISINPQETSEACAVDRKDSLFSENRYSTNLPRTQSTIYNMYRQAKTKTDPPCKPKELRPKQRKLYSSVVAEEKNPQPKFDVSYPDFEKSLHLHLNPNKPIPLTKIAGHAPEPAPDKNFQMGEFMEYLKERLTKQHPNPAGDKQLQQESNSSALYKPLQKIRDPITSKKSNPPILCYAVNSVSGSGTNFDRIAVFFKVIEWNGKKYPFSYFGLYRGSSNSRGANILKHNFHEWIFSSPHFPSSISSSILDAVSKANDQFVTEGEERDAAICGLVTVGKRI